MAADSSGPDENLPQVVSSSRLFDFISKLLKVTLGAKDHELISLKAPVNEARLVRFACDPASSSLFVQKYAGDSDPSGPERDFRYTITNELDPSNSIVASLAVLKHSSMLSVDFPLQDQVQIINLPGCEGGEQGYSAYESLHSLIKLAISPYFDSFSKITEMIDNRGRRIGDSKKGIPATRKKLAELELSLLHLQQNIEIPNVVLSAHPIIQQAIKNAAADHTRPTINSLQDSKVLEDTAIMNAIQATTVTWRQQIKQVTEKDRDPHSGTASQEVNFWLNLDQVLADIEIQLKSDPVALTFDVLAGGKRLGVNSAMIMQDTGFRDARDKVKSYSMLMRDFPLNDLLSAASLDKAAEAVDQVFELINRRLRSVPYPVARAIPLAEAITKDIETQVYMLLRGRRLMHLEFEPFSDLLFETYKVFAAYDNKIRDFITTARDVLRKRSEKFLVVKVTAAHSTLQERLNYLRQFRQAHQQLSTTIGSILGTDPNSFDGSRFFGQRAGELDALQEIKAAYATLKDIDVLDISPEGTEIWVVAEQGYDDRIARVEATIISLMRGRLDASETANEMFRVFSTFNALFIRPKIRGAIQEYQNQLIDGVKTDIARLQDKFRLNYANSDAYLLNTLRDIPPVSGHIIWARQINRQLDSYMERVETVLGDGWHLYADGQKLHTESDSFRKRLDVRPVFDQWFKETYEHDNLIKGAIFIIHRNRANGNKLELTVNFDKKAINLFKEVRNLLHLGFSIPHQINTAAKTAKLVYPHAMSIIDSNTIMQRVFVDEQGLGEIVSLSANFHNDVLTKLKSVALLSWDYFREESSRSRRAAQIVAEWSTAVLVLQAKVDILGGAKDKVQAALLACQSCPYTSADFSPHVNALQVVIDQLSLQGYVNLHDWVHNMNAKLENVLIQRARSAVQIWLTHYKSQSRILSEETVSPGAVESLDSLNFVVLKHEIVLKDQVISLDPPLEFARASWHSQLSSYIRIVCRLPRLQSSRYEMDLLDKEQQPASDFSKIATCIAMPDLQSAHTAIQNTIHTIQAYVTKWLQFQSLWDLRPEQLWDLLGDDIDKWLQILAEIRKTRATFDTTGQYKKFAHLHINYEQVQTRVTGKYDAWQKDVLVKFALHLGNRMHDTYTAMCSTRRDLETQSLDSSVTASAVSFITSVQKCTRSMKMWEAELQQYKLGQSTLFRQRFQLSNSWLFVERLEDEWVALVEIYTRKNKLVIDQVDALRSKINAEDAILRSRMSETITDWVQQKPLAGDIEPQNALVTLQNFERRLNDHRQERDMVIKAKEALELPSVSEVDLDVTTEEIQDFLSVWSAVSSIWTGLNDLKETMWSAVVPRKLRTSLDVLNTTTKNMPSRMRQYAAFDYVQNIIKKLTRANVLLTDLKSDAIRERHWNKVLKHLRPRERLYLPSLTLGTVWDLDLVDNETFFKEVISEAQGELALEQFLSEVRDRWGEYTLELVHFQNKCRLIKGWDDLFVKSSEDLNALLAMKHSPHFKIFEDEALAWEDKLTRIHLLFDVWIDVQRQWVYLEGIFTGNVDIKHLLPAETLRFQNINTEFFTMMKKVALSPLVLDVISIPGAQKQMDRLAEMLQNIQKALGEYLERERTQFPRFYFVGDEDLLELIGNSKDLPRIQKHLRKMFAGIDSLSLNQEQTAIVSISSKEYETVTLVDEVSLIRSPKINEWLAALEIAMRQTIASLSAKALQDFQSLLEAEDEVVGKLQFLLDTYPTQVLVLSFQCASTLITESALGSESSALVKLEMRLNDILACLATIVLSNLEVLQRLKCESIITVFVHHRDVVSKLVRESVTSVKDFRWQYFMRFYSRLGSGTALEVLVKVANAEFAYGFEYLGVPDRLVQTPLTDRCYLTLTQALSQKLGGSPFGPAGTGKTETVKALGVHLGRFVLVFCCDETFDFQSMGRIFLGLTQVGAWGCFDEFNRLEERMLSAVSQQIQTIQIGLSSLTDHKSSEIELVGRQINLNENTGIFITMNPGYAGRSNLPDNLKKLFRSIAMSKPDKELIAQVTFYSQGFRYAPLLASQIVPVFERCHERLSKQAHYDFGLRALKSVLTTCGNLKRASISLEKNDFLVDHAWEAGLVVRSMRESIMPKLVDQDPEILATILNEVFPQIEYVPTEFSQLSAAIHQIAASKGLGSTDQWMTKIIQLHQIILVHHGIMMVGEAGSGKTQTWSLLSSALTQMDGIETISYVIDAKTMSKEALYGKLDFTTREWTDGLFTSIIRKITDNLRGEASKRHWIVFDGDVDPEWVESMNSMLDDNKLLTLPNGERLSLLSNVKIMFEVESLKYATLATVSRCGMVYFNQGHTPSALLLAKYLHELNHTRLPPLEDDFETNTPEAERMQQHFAAVLSPYFGSAGLVLECLRSAFAYEHIMVFTESRAITTLLALMTNVCRLMIKYNNRHRDFPLSSEQSETFISKKLLISMIWAFAGDCPQDARDEFGNKVAHLSSLGLPNIAKGFSILDYNVELPKCQWFIWSDRVPVIDVDPKDVIATDLVIPTTDTVRQEAILYSYLSEHKTVILCGPPGSGKTMTLFSAMRTLPDLEVVALNFSSATTSELVLKTLEQYCEYRKTLNGTKLCPTTQGKWLVLFCDEINLPLPDRYGTQQVIAFMKQLVEFQGFWRASDRAWISLERIQFVGACNPPSDVGRTRLPARFLRHAPVIMVGYPSESSLKQIYGVFARATLKFVPNLRGYAEPLTNSMVDLYMRSRERFSVAQQPHYIYSPREMTRWIRGIWEAIRSMEGLSLEGLVRIWAHEGSRLFEDRLVTTDERLWTRQNIKEVASIYFPNINEAEALEGPLLYSGWLSQHYVPVNREVMRQYIRARLKTFCEEEVDTPLVPYDEMIEHVLKIDRVFKQPQGHLILIGISGSGKTTLSRFVAWMNGLKTFQIRVHRKYSAADFDEDLRNVLRRCGTNGEKICFILDESNVLDSGFLERMNTLLANAEIPGLFEGDEYTALMTACRDGSRRDGLILDSKEELYQWYTAQIVRNLHVVFTMNPPDDLSAKVATSPALFNRCVLNWFGDWSGTCLYQVGHELIRPLDLEGGDFVIPLHFALTLSTYKDVVAKTFVILHQIASDHNQSLAKCGRPSTYLTPRNFLDMIRQFLVLYEEKKDEMEDQQRHINMGLEKLHATVDQVSQLRASLAIKKEQLEIKNQEANLKLQSMVQDQQEAQQKKIASLEIQENISVQEKEIHMRRTVVLGDLALAEPAVVEAQNSVSNIKKQQLTEVRSMVNPPEAVKLAMESVCTLLGHQVEGWKSVQSIIRRDDFISSIVHFDNEAQMTPELRIFMKREYMTKPIYQYEAVNRASKACGPLVQWVHAQVIYSEILDKVGPLREEVDSLEKEASLTRRKADTMIEMIQELEESISRYKVEYAQLISDTQAIKTEMLEVEGRVTRSVKLLESLTSEKERWQSSSQTFISQANTLAGDVMLAAAFLAYSGFFDQTSRQTITEQWRHKLDLSLIEYTRNIPVGNFLASAEDRSTWISNGLPGDELCVENAVMLKRSIRYPLIVDPSGRAAHFLGNQHKSRTLVTTSFLDESFLKHLETALRFGTPILINDAEYFDPIVNKILNREYQKTGGRTLISLGKQDIDISASFKLFLMTRNPLAKFTPDICSRVALVNFTVTKSSLETQVLNTVLKSERPDIEERRDTLIKAQGVFNLRLRRLEKDLLKALSDSQGSILESDSVIETLERLKSEAAEISGKVLESAGVMQELEMVAKSFARIGTASCKIFAILEQLVDLNHFYRFSLKYFEDVFSAVLQQVKEERTLKDQELRVDWIVRALYAYTFRKTCQTLLHKDHTTLALSLATAMSSSSDQQEVFKALLNSSTPEFIDKSGQNMEERILEGLEGCSFPMVARAFRSTEFDPVMWEQFFTSSPTEQVTAKLLPGIARLGGSENLLLLRIFRLNKLMPAIDAYCFKLFSDVLKPESDYDLRTIVMDETEASTPLMLVSVPGFDAAYRVDSLVQRTGTRCVSIAMGSIEGIAQAEKAIVAAVQYGTWVLLKNVHLAIAWLGELEKKIFTLRPTGSFRLFLTLEMSLKVPINLIRLSRVVSFETHPGMRASVSESLDSIPQTLLQKAPVERSRLYFLLSWLHSIILERLRYPGIGWSQVYDFNDSDFESARRVAGAWLDLAASGRENIAPNKLPWRAIRTILSESVYGGRLDNTGDQAVLDNLINRILAPEAYDIGYLLVDTNDEKLQIPDAVKMQQFMEWTQTLTEHEPPTWLGLQPDAQQQRLETECRRMLADVAAIDESISSSNEC